jgi:hypothetical protein
MCDVISERVLPSAIVPFMPSPAASRPHPLTRAEIFVLAAALAALAALRWLSVASHHWNSDEPQHLHVVWSWTVGLLQYQQTFDNHTPLFHILFAPLLSWLGERADIVLPMRRAMIPLFAIAVWCVYRLGALVFDRRTGWFAALLAAFLPAFFFRMGEFRTDVMWTTLWLGTLVVALEGRPTPLRTFTAALLLGAAFGVSMKSTLLVLCLAVAGIITWALAGAPVSKSWPQHLVAFVIGLLVVPGAIVGYFASRGALQPLYHCVIEHNTASGQHFGAMLVKQLLSKHTLWLLPAAAGLWWMLPDARLEGSRGYRRVFLFVVVGTFYSLLHGFWPIVTTQDYLPWLPLVPIFAVAAWQWLRTHGETRWQWHLPWLVAPALLLAVEMVWIVREEPPLKNAEDRRVAHLAATLRLADRGEYVYDLKGETIYRPRPTYLVFETLTRQQILDGRLTDDSIPRLIATRTAVTRPSKRMMDPAKRFLEENYVRVEGCHTLGKRLAVTGRAALSFQIIIPEKYGVIGREGEVKGALDGQPLDGPRWLEAGPHSLVVTNAISDAAVMWQRAIERGYSPYHPSPDDADSN